MTISLSQYGFVLHLICINFIIKCDKKNNKTIIILVVNNFEMPTLTYNLKFAVLLL